MQRNPQLWQTYFFQSPAVVAAVKFCPRCRNAKPLSEFSSRSVRRLRPCSYCRDCQREYCKEHYQRHKPAHNVRRYQRQKITRLEMLKRVALYKRSLKCYDCGEADPVVLDLDHVRGNKTDNISRMLFTTTWTNIEDELKKCDVRCANCHRRRTAREYGWKVPGPPDEQYH